MKKSFFYISILILLYLIFCIYSFSIGKFVKTFWITISFLFLLNVLLILILNKVTKFKYLKISAVIFLANLSLISYKLYSPKLEIIVPKNFEGEINLVLSNTKNNILEIDKNGIGYINKFTFDKVYKKPLVTDSEGNEITHLCKGYNSTTYYGIGTYYLNKNDSVKTLQFEVIRNGKKKRDIFEFNDLRELFDKSLLYEFKK
ncbi:hypothetical protein [Flavobacterium sp.]|uniref:hypothetical protein n=1 Tax=Flavobacterium sp. TaxID=239 RepID=UPI00404778E3